MIYLLQHMKNIRKGFTLLEILLVVAIIAILAGIVIVAINPAKQLGNTRDAQRRSDILTLYKAVNEYIIDNGFVPPVITSTLTPICNTGVNGIGATTCLDVVDLSLLVPTYVSSIPRDPQATSTAGYLIARVGSNIYIEAPGTEVGFTSQSGYSSTTPVIAFIGHLPSGHYPSAVSSGNNGGGGETSWTCGSALIDIRDSRSYTTVLIGSQCWMQENINVGTMIAGSNDQGTSPSSIDKYCYNDDEGNCTTYGGLYQWGQAMEGSVSPGIQGICPTSWHIPTHDEFTTLERSLCTSGTCTSDFPYDGTQGWRGTDEGTTLRDMAGLFKTKLAGIRYNIGGAFYTLGSDGFLWTSSQNDSYSAWHRHVDSSYTSVYRSPDDTAYGFSVRCLKD